MSWLMVYALNKDVSTIINKYCDRHPDLVIAKLQYKIVIFKNNGIILSHLVKLKKRHGEWIELYVIEPLELFTIPEKIKKVGEYLADHPRTSTEKAIKHIPEIKDIKELRKCQIKFERTRD